MGFNLPEMGFAISKLILPVLVLSVPTFYATSDLSTSGSTNLQEKIVERE